MHHLNLYFTKYAYEILCMIISIFREESLFAPLFTSSPFCERKGHLQVQDSSHSFKMCTKLLRNEFISSIYRIILTVDFFVRLQIFEHVLVVCNLWKTYQSHL